MWHDRERAAALSRATLVAEEEAYVPGELELNVTAAATWREPAPQQRGTNWVYDLFTPPQIVYDPHTQRFAVARSDAAVPSGDKIEMDPIELLGVRQELYPLQLIGFVGRDGDWKGTFHNVTSGETFLASAPREIAPLGLTIELLTVEPEPVALPESTPTRQRLARATVHEVKTGRRVRLSDRERCFDDVLVAIIRTADRDVPRAVSAGETVRAGDREYCIERLQLVPPAAEVVVRIRGGERVERRTLVVRSPHIAAARSDSK